MHSIRKPWLRHGTANHSWHSRLLTHVSVMGDEQMFGSDFGFEPNGLIWHLSIVPVFPNVWGNRRYPELVMGAKSPHLLM